MTLPRHRVWRQSVTACGRDSDAASCFTRWGTPTGTSLLRTKSIEQSIKDTDDPDTKLRKDLGALDLVVYFAYGRRHCWLGQAERQVSVR